MRYTKVVTMLDAYILVSIVMFLVSTRPGVSASKCVDPLNVTEITQQLENRIKNNYLNYMSFFNIISEPNRVGVNQNVTDGDMDKTIRERGAKSHVYISRLIGKTRCLKKRHFRSGLNHPANELSSCPWYFVVEVDSDRIPSSVVKAKCSCTNCLVPTRYGYRRDRNEKNGFCKEISYSMPVIRRECVGGVYKYEIALEDIAVGCTCQRCNRNRKQGSNLR